MLRLGEVSQGQVGWVFRLAKRQIFELRENVIRIFAEDCALADQVVAAAALLAAWAHAVDIDGAREHYHKVGTELYYVLDGEGSVMLDGVEHPVHTGSIVHIPPGVVHGARGRMRVLVVGIPDISDDDLFFPEDDEIDSGEAPDDE